MANSINYLSQIQTGQTIQATHVNQFVEALSGSKAYDLVTSGSYTIIGPLNATASSANKPYIASNNSTNNEYTLVFKNSTAALNDFHQLAADGSNGPYYNPSSNTLTVPVLSGSAVQAASLTGSFLGNVNGSSSYATTASYALTSSYASNGTSTLTYGAFYDTTDQNITQNTSSSFAFNSTQAADGINIGSPSSRLVVTRTGVYNIQFSAQLSLTSGAQGTAYIWISKNGTNITFTNTGVYMQNTNEKYVAAWNFVEPLTAGDYIEFMIYANGADMQLVFEPPIPGPGGNGNVAVPSIIATLTQIK